MLRSRVREPVGRGDQASAVPMRPGNPGWGHPPRPGPASARHPGLLTGTCHRHCRSRAAPLHCLQELGLIPTLPALARLYPRSRFLSQSTERLISHPWAYSSLRHLGPQTDFYQLSFVDYTAGNDHAPLNGSRDFTTIRNVVSSLTNSSEDGIGVNLPEWTLVATNIGLSRAFDCIC